MIDLAASSLNVQQPPQTLNPIVEAELYCREYAHKAVLDNDENIHQRCGYQGTAWSSNAQLTYNWCISSSNWKFAAPTLEASRQNELAQCAVHYRQVKR